MLENLTTKDQERLCTVLRESLERHFPLYSQTNQILAAPINNTNTTWIGYFTGNTPIQEEATHLDLNIEGNICFLLSIGLDQEERGKGHGRALYKAVEEFATIIGCSSVQMTASGQTKTGETRKEYMLRLGYTPLGDIEVKKKLTR